MLKDFAMQLFGGYDGLTPEFIFEIIILCFVIELMQLLFDFAKGRWF